MLYCSCREAVSNEKSCLKSLIKVQRDTTAVRAPCRPRRGSQAAAVRPTPAWSSPVTPGRPPLPSPVSSRVKRNIFNSKHYLSKGLANLISPGKRSQKALKSNFKCPSKRLRKESHFMSGCEIPSTDFCRGEYNYPIPKNPPLYVGVVGWVVYRWLPVQMLDGSELVN